MIYVVRFLNLRFINFQIRIMIRNRTFAEKYNLEPGDVLIEPKSQFEVVDHYIVYLGKGIEGWDRYMENYPYVGVQYISETDFSNIKRIRRFEGNQDERKLAVNRAVSLHRENYDLINFNCEHFANYVQYNIPFSKQVGTARKVVGTLIVGSVIVGLISKLDSRKQRILGILLIGVLFVVGILYVFSTNTSNQNSYS
jgi:hypothetical protein